MCHKRRKIIPVAQKSALCLVLSDVPTTQQGRRKTPCHEKPDDGSWFDRGGGAAAARGIVSAPARINAAGLMPC